MNCVLDEEEPSDEDVAAAACRMTDVFEHRPHLKTSASTSHLSVRLSGSWRSVRRMPQARPARHSRVGPRVFKTPGPSGKYAETGQQPPSRPGLAARDTEKEHAMKNTITWMAAGGEGGRGGGDGLPGQPWPGPPVPPSPDGGPKYTG